MKSFKQQRSESHRRSDGTEAPADFLLPWADPYIAHLEKHYRLEAEEPHRTEPASPPRGPGAPLRPGSRNPKPERFATRRVGWSLRRTVAPEPASHPGL